MDKIAPNIYVESTYRGSTVGAILTPTGVICVDTPMLPADARHWRTQIAHLSKLPIRYVIYTDGHRDRVLGQQWLGGLVVGHEQTWEKMRGYGDTLRQQVVEFLAHHGALEAAEELSHQLQLALPQITLSHGTLVLQAAKPRVVVRPVGGVSPGSLWVELPEQGVVFTGDLVTLSTHPFMSEADTVTWLNRLAELRDPDYPLMKIVPGRGNSYKRADSQKVSAYLTEMRDRVRELLRQHRGKIDVTESMPEYLDRFPIPFGENERIQHRIRTGLERVSEEIKAEKKKRQR
jgi:glyoxylase-like metal-dependent hydrolase (beta-lactamase superfamily II)